MIPRLIHQTFPDKRLPEELQENARIIRSMNKEYEYHFYDNHDVKDFIHDAYGKGMLSTFLSINKRYGAARADLFRYLLAYAKGGVYLDIKSTTTAPLCSSLRDDDCLLLSHWEVVDGREHWGKHSEVGFLDAGEFQQWHVISAPKHALIERVVEEVCRRIREYRPWSDGAGWRSVLRTTGPIVYTQTIALGLPMRGVRVVRGEGEIGLKYSVYEGDGHKRLFSKHYEELAEPLVVPFGPRGAYFWAYHKQAQVRGNIKQIMQRG